jgi:hypothetical protein
MGGDAVKDEDRDEHGGQEAGASAPASPGAGSVPPVAHPGFQTGVVHVEPELRDEVAAYWKEYAAWEKTRQGPPPRAPSVSVRVDHEGKPTEAAGLRQAVAGKKGGKSAGRKFGGRSPWAGDEAAAVIDKSALPLAHRPRSDGAEKKDETGARPGKVRRVGTAVAALALAAGIGAAAMCGVKERTPAESAAAVRGTASDAASGERAMSDAAASGERRADDTPASNAVANDERADSDAAAVEESAPVDAGPEASVGRAAPAGAPRQVEGLREARPMPAPEAHSPAPAAQRPKPRPSPEATPGGVAESKDTPAIAAPATAPVQPEVVPPQPPPYVEGVPEF